MSILIDAILNINKNDYKCNDFNYFITNITDPNQNDYIKNRIINQISWYDYKSVYNQKSYKLITCICIILTGLIPILTIITSSSIVVKIIIAVFSSSSTILNSILMINKHKDLWVQYRSNCEILKSTLFQYFTDNGIFYNCDECLKFAKLVDICENYLTSEYKSWKSIYEIENNCSTNQSSSSS